VFRSRTGCGAAIGKASKPEACKPCRYKTEPGMTANRKTLITVIGGSKATRAEALTAEEVGREIARRGAVLVCGGLGGIMEAACRGAKSEGGLTVGILPGIDRESANDYVDIPLATGLGYARNVLVAYSGDAVIAIGGMHGTLSEMAFASIKGAPVISLGSWELDEKRLPEPIHRAKDAKEAVDKAFRLIAKRRAKKGPVKKL